MKRFALLLLASLLLGTSAALAQDSADLSGYDFVIGDTGDYHEGWDNYDTRVYAKVIDGRGYREHYFDSLPAAFFVLREKYGTVRVTDMQVPEFPVNSSHRGHMLDAQQAWYVWDYDSRSVGGLPLVMAFAYLDDARDAAGARRGDVLDFAGVMSRLGSWCHDSRERTYWRGWHSDQWDNRSWNNSWNSRWDGWDWDRSRGWVDVNFKIGDFNVSLGTGSRGRDRHRGHEHYDRYCYPRFADRWSHHGWWDNDHHGDRGQGRGHWSRGDNDRGHGRGGRSEGGSSHSRERSGSGGSNKSGNGNGSRDGNSDGGGSGGSSESYER